MATGDRAVLGGSGWDTSLGEAIPVVTLGAPGTVTGEDLAVLGGSGYDVSLGRQLGTSGTGEYVASGYVAAGYV